MQSGNKHIIDTCGPDQNNGAVRAWSGCDDLHSSSGDKSVECELKGNRCYLVGNLFPIPLEIRSTTPQVLRSFSISPSICQSVDECVRAQNRVIGSPYGNAFALPCCWLHLINFFLSFACCHLGDGNSKAVLFRPGCIYWHLFRIRTH